MRPGGVLSDAVSQSADSLWQAAAAAALAANGVAGRKTIDQPDNLAGTLTFGAYLQVIQQLFFSRLVGKTPVETLIRDILLTGSGALGGGGGGGGCGGGGSGGGNNSHVNGNNGSGGMNGNGPSGGGGLGGSGGGGGVPGGCVNGSPPNCSWPYMTPM